MKHKLSTIFLLSISWYGNFSCQKIKDPNLPESPSFYVRAKVDGQDVAIELLSTNQVQLGTFNSADDNPPACIHTYGSFLGPQFGQGGEGAGIEFKELFNGNCTDEDAVFNTLFKLGTYVVNEPLGVVIRYNDDTGTYTSLQGTQTDPQFSIIESTSANDETGKGQNVTGKFQCTVYNDFGGKKELTEGSFRLQFRTY